MKKVLRILLIVIGAILLILILIPILFRSRIETLVKQKINENVAAVVDWDRFSLTFFRGFPDLSVNLHEVSVVGIDEFAGDTLAGLERFELRVNPFSTLSKNVEIKSILVHRPLINGEILEDGKASWDIAKTGEEAETEKPEAKEEPVVEEKQEKMEESGESGMKMALSLKRFAIEHGRIFYSDIPGGIEASLEDLNLELSGDFSMEKTVLSLGIDIGRINAVMGGVRYMRDGTFGLELRADADMVNNTYSLLDNEIRINGLVLGIEGVVSMPEDGGISTDLSYFTRQTSFGTLLSMVPAIYLSDFESLETRGNLSLEGTVKGLMKDSILPDVTLNLKVTDGYFSYPDLPKDVSDVQIAVRANYNGTDMDRSTVDVEQFHLLLGGNPFEVRLKVDHPVSDMHVAGTVKGMVDFSTLKEVVPLENTEIGGKLTADLSLDSYMSYFEEERYEEVDLDGLLAIEGMQLESESLPVPVSLQKMEMHFTPKIVVLSGLDLQMGASDLHMNGELSNFIPYVFQGSAVSGSLDVRSSMLDVDELMPKADTATEAVQETEAAETEDQEPVAVPPDSLAQPSQVKIPDNIAFRLGLDLKQVKYGDILLENIRGSMTVKDGVANLDGLNLNVIEGSVTASGLVDTRGEYTAADLSLDMKGVDIPSAYTTFVTVERLAPMAKYCRGNANVKVNLESLLDASFSPIYGSVQADGRIFTRDLQVYNTNTFVKLSELLKNDRYREIAPDNMDIHFRIRDGRVLVDPFDMKVEHSVMRVSGSHGIDMTLDYLLDMDIAREDLGRGANDLINGITALAAGTGLAMPVSETINVKARITGTFDDPKVSTDLSGNLKQGSASVKEAVKEAVEQRVTEEVEKVEEQVREEASQKAEEIIREAEQEAEKIMEEARRAGDELVKEAGKQGDNLVKEAGNNPLKKRVAQESAKELVRQAESQRAKLLEEAQAKADQVIAAAREEAEKI